MRRLPIAVAFASLFSAACASADAGGAPRWTGTVDTLPSGQVVVTNTARPLWPEGREWQVVEEFRIGSVEGDGPEVFGRIVSFEVDPSGRIWVLESQSQQLRVFDAAGAFVRTIGRSGGGPGEFAQAVRVEPGPDGHMWVMDPSNNRLSVFDSAGVYLEGRHALGGFIIIPWPGRFDAQGRYYAPVPFTDGEFRIGMVRYDAAFAPTDTLVVPRDPVERDRFEHSMGGGRMIAGVPFQGRLQWVLSRAGAIWCLITDQYRLFEIDPAGDTLRTITRAFDPIPVTEADREQAREDLDWFVSQGGQVDWSRLPDTKPLATSFFLADDGDLWVGLATPPDSTGSRFDVFDPAGRYLGTVRVPFPLSSSPAPILRNDVLYGVTLDEMDVPFIVKARIVRP